jgi:hypothetical protein
VEKTGENNRKVGKIGQFGNQAPPLAQNMIKFKHDGLEISRWRTCWKRYDGVDTPRWNLEIEPFVAQ